MPNKNDSIQIIQDSAKAIFTSAPLPCTECQEVLKEDLEDAFHHPSRVGADEDGNLEVVVRGHLAHTTLHDIADLIDEIHRWCADGHPEPIPIRS